MNAYSVPPGNHMNEQDPGKFHNASWKFRNKTRIHEF